MWNAILDSRAGQIGLFCLTMFGPLLLQHLLGWPNLPSWDNCTIGWAVPC